MTDRAITNMDPDHVLLIDLSWANSNLLGLSCPFCLQEMDWGIPITLNDGTTLRDRETSDTNECPHLEFASYDCLPFGAGLSQISEQITELKQLYDQFQKNFVDGFDLEQSWYSNDSKIRANMKRDVEQIEQFRQEIISSLEDHHYFVRPHGYYTGYIKYIEKELGDAEASIREWIVWSETDPVEQSEIDELVEDAMYDVKQEALYELDEEPNYEANMSSHFFEYMRHEVEEEVRNELAREYIAEGPGVVGLIDTSLLSDFVRFCHETFEPGLIITFMARGSMSDQCWCVIYSSCPSYSSASDLPDQTNYDVLPF